MSHLHVYFVSNIYLFQEILIPARLFETALLFGTINRVGIFYILLIFLTVILGCTYPL